MYEALVKNTETSVSTTRFSSDYLVSLDRPLNKMENNDVNKSNESPLNQLDRPLNQHGDGNIGNKVSFDDNGTPYKNESGLLPNTEYTVNGYDYKTDDQGRIISASGELRLKDREGRNTINESLSSIGKGDERSTDIRGHLIGDQFDGSNKIDNLVPMDTVLNNGDYKAMELKLAKAVREGKETNLKVEPMYEGDSNRPSSFLATYSIDGVESVVFFRNGGNS